MVLDACGQYQFEDIRYKWGTQGSRLGPLLLCIINKYLPDLLMFSEPFNCTEDLKILAVQRRYWEVKVNLHGIENWVIQNEMELPIDKCAYLKFGDRDQQYKLIRKDLAKSTTFADF